MSGAEDVVGDWISIDEAAARLDFPVSRVRQLLREGRLIALRRERNLQMPAAFVHDGAVLKGLTGTLTLLRDAGYSAEESLCWLFTPDDTLPGSPVQALAENRGAEVKRRAQALGY